MENYIVPVLPPLDKRIARARASQRGVCLSVYYTMSSSSSAAVRVAVRVRPFNEREVHRQSKCVIRMKGRQTELLKPNEAESTKKFTFDYSVLQNQSTHRHFNVRV